MPLSSHKYGQGGALGLATYLRIDSNLEIWQVRKIGGRPQYFRMTHYTEILNVFWKNLDYQWCTMLFSNRVVLYIIWNWAEWYSKLVNMNKRYIRKHDFSKWLKVCRNTKKESFTIDNVSIVKKCRKKRFGLWKYRCSTHSEVWMWRMHQWNLHWRFTIARHSTPFLAKDSSIYHRILHFYMGRIPPWSVFLASI